MEEEFLNLIEDIEKVMDFIYYTKDKKKLRNEIKKIKKKVKKDGLESIIEEGL